MKRLIVLPFLCMASACQDGTPVQPDLDGSPLLSLAANGAAQALTPGFVPLKGEGTWEWDGIFLPPGERCLSAGGMAEVHFTGNLRLTHLGLTANDIVQCFDFSASPPQVFTLETLTAANGDRLILYEGSIYPGPLPPGYSWGYLFEVEGGTGRFQGATGEGRAYGTVTGMGGKEVIEGMVTSVGSIEED